MLPSPSLPTSSLRFVSRCFLARPCLLEPPIKEFPYLAVRWRLDATVISSKLRCIGYGDRLIDVGVEESKRSDKMSNGPSVDDGFFNEFEKQLDIFFAEIKNMLKLGDKNGASALLLANYAATKEQIDLGKRGIKQAATLDVVALGYLAAGELKLVEHLLDMLTEIVGGLNDDNRLLDSVLIHMGSMYMALGKCNEAILVYGRATEIIEQLYGKKNPFLVMPLLGRAKVFKSMGNLAKAIENYEEAVNILEASRGHESEELVMPLFELGNIFIDDGRLTDAESFFGRILHIYKKAYGEADGRVGMARCFLARALCAKGNITEAIEEYENGLQIVRDSNYMAFDDDVLQKMRVELAELLHLAGRVQEGREYLEESLLVAEKCKGSGHPSLVRPLLNLSTSYLHSKNYVEAERLVRFSLQLLSKNKCPIYQDITFPQLLLAIILYSQGKDREAETVALQVLHSREAAFGKYSLPVGEALDCLVSIQVRLGEDDDKLLEQLKRVLEIQEKHLGYDSEDIIETLEKIMFFLEKTGRRNEKPPLQRRLSALRSKYDKIPL